MKRLPVLLLCLFASFSDAASAQTPASASDLIARAHSLTDIHAPGSAPFHLRGTFQASGAVEFTGDGTYDELWLSPDQWRMEVILGAYHAVWGKNAAGLYKDESDSYRPSRVELLLETLHPAAHSASQRDNAGWITTKQPDGTTELTQRPKPFRTEIYKTIYDLNERGVPVLKVQGGQATRSGDYAALGARFFLTGNPSRSETRLCCTCKLQSLSRPRTALNRHSVVRAVLRRAHARVFHY